jgi:hypothetical protein
MLYLDHEISDSLNELGSLNIIVRQQQEPSQSKYQQEPYVLFNFYLCALLKHSLLNIICHDEYSLIYKGKLNLLLTEVIFYNYYHFIIGLSLAKLQIFLGHYLTQPKETHRYTSTPVCVNGAINYPWGGVAQFNLACFDDCYN